MSESDEAELCIPLPNVFHGVRFVRIGSGPKSETDLDSTTLDLDKLSVDGATELRSGIKTILQHHGYTSEGPVKETGPLTKIFRKDSLDDAKYDTSHGYDPKANALHCNCRGCSCEHLIGPEGATCMSTCCYDEIDLQLTCEHHELHTCEAFRQARYGCCSKFEASVAIADGKLTPDARDTFAACESVRTNGSKSEGLVQSTVGEASKETKV